MDPSLVTTNLVEDDATCTSSASDRVYVGGNVYFLSSLETRWRIGESWGAVAFVDVGEIWDRLRTVSLRDTNVAVGPGLRYNTPFGPVRADLGFLVTSPTPPDVTFHISIGQAF